MTFKKTEVVMLTTNQQAKEGLLVLKTHRLGDKQLSIIDRIEQQSTLKSWDCNGNLITQDNIFEIDENWIDLSFQHLYFYNDDEIKKDDWFFNGERILQCSRITDVIIDTEGQWSNIKASKKVIATTDLEIAIKKGEYNIGEISRKIMIPTETKILHQPSKSFIEKFIAMYNKNTPITECLIEYENIEYGHVDNFNEPHGFIDILKVNSNNEITIKPCKESWNREEVIDIINKFIVEFIGVKGTEDFDYYEKTGDFKEFIKQNL